MTTEQTLLETDIEAYLQKHEDKDMLRFLTCGNVDDGKSTLIGRLLHDSKLIFEDHMAAIKCDSKKYNTTDGEFDLALLVDGLQSEREQGITIDVAYRYFATESRKFIIADCPGHEQYTRNMATGASNCDLAIVMIDARYGVQTQTKRHSYIASLLGIKHVIVAVNKMDLVDYSQAEYRKIKSAYKAFAQDLNIPDIRFVPISALKGDNVVNKSESMDWYPGATLMELLNSVTINEDKNLEDFRFPVQFVTRPNLDFRGFCGTIAAGVISVGDVITAMPSGKSSTVARIVTADGDLTNAFAGQAITITTNDEIDISRGDVLVKSNQLATASDSFEATIVWMDEVALQPGKEYEFKVGTKNTYGRIGSINHRIDVNTLKQIEVNAMQLNEIASCNVHVSSPVVIDVYNNVKGTGSFVVIDRLTNVTVGAGMITKTTVSEARSSKLEARVYTQAEIELNAYVRKCFPEWDCHVVECIKY
ncbi:sulfate adenylyltransferase subunit 1 [Shewanella hanedai]|uniref:Sulfate adenylyltransferase subunit 1 n=1 Tax=Shewanella hanedai TaxID=25 RepID=A0A553JMQ5_SHEHA|nr:sulfate adenylyltransferase subunit CysN [Shewanella hanedai]TRY13680.1 sulfate adenylyltransferase subunit CysN [Shewanella hanedai]GGI98599.1 sulfate adenylyltransferase subunit 1 [Shewanella hanedai]